MPTGWRIVKTKYAAQAFDGEGARLYGGRWNSPGVRMTYTAGSVSLAVLEVLVYLNNSSIMSSYSLCAVEFDEPMVMTLDEKKLPAGWRQYPAPLELQSIGNDWIASQASVILIVPSAIVEVESNYLINPSHPDYSLITIGDPQQFEFDPRLLKR
jgi:RES domain-containing protein